MSAAWMSRLHVDLGLLRDSRDFRVLFGSRTVTLLGSQATPRISLCSGGLACVAAVVVICAALPGFTRYRAGG